MPALEMAVADGFHLLAAPKELDGRCLEIMMICSGITINTKATSIARTRL